MKKIIILVLVALTTLSMNSVTASNDLPIPNFNKTSLKLKSIIKKKGNMDKDFYFGIYMKNDDNLLPTTTSEMSIEEIRLLKNEYISNVIKSNENLTAHFSEDYGSDFDIVFQSKFASFIVVKANYMEIKSLLKNDDILFVEVYKDHIDLNNYVYDSDKLQYSDLTAYVSYSPGDARVNSASLSIDFKDVTNINTAKSLYNVSGEGIRIGVLDIGVIDSNHDELRTKSNIVDTTEPVDEHATLVSMFAAGTTYGVANDSNIISIGAGTTVTPISIFNDLESMVIMGADVINMSIGTDESGLYDNFSRYIDCLVNETKVLITVAAGNDGTRHIYHETGDNNLINNFGSSQNVLTVGSTNPNATFLSTDSSTDELPNGDSYISYKPNIVSPGGTYLTYFDNTIMEYGAEVYPIYYPDSPYRADSSLEADEDAQIHHVGTSIAAPIVAGAVALLYEYSPQLLFHPERTIAIITAGSSYDSLDGEEEFINSSGYNYSTFNITGPVSSHGLNDYAGAGKLDMVEVLEIAGNYNYFYLSTCSSTLGSVFEKKLNFIKDDTVRLSFAFLRNIELDGMGDPDDYTFDDYNIRISGPSGFYETTLSDYSNNELLEFVIPETGVYTIQVILVSKSNAPGSTTNNRFTNISFAISTDKGYTFYVPATC